jgi:hypothetical protein
MIKGRRCYCGRLYPGFRCAYCRIGDYLADDVQPDPRLVDPKASPRAALLTRLSSYGKSVMKRLKK